MDCVVTIVAAFDDALQTGFYLGWRRGFHKHDVVPVGASRTTISRYCRAYRANGENSNGTFNL
jgi:hypothetical protein